MCALILDIKKVDTAVR